MNIYDEKLNNLNIVLPTVDRPTASYRNYITSGNLVFISGQTPLAGMGVKHQGTIGDDLTIKEAYFAAENCALQLVAVMKEACNGDLSLLKQVIKVTAMLAVAEHFEEHSAVVDGCSNLLVAIFGEAGEHARFSIGVNNLPGNAPIEIEMIFEKV